MNKVAVIGIGAMGSGIAYVSAWKGYNVKVRDVSEEFVELGMNKIRQSVMTGIDKGKLSPIEGEKMLKNIQGTTDIKEAAQDADLVIEAVFEDMKIKKEVFSDLDKVCPESTVLASNTSTKSITEIASQTSRPEKVIGMHFFNPVPAMKLVELVMGEKTSEETYKAAEEFCKNLGKTTVRARDSPGFIVNRILLPTLNEAMKLADSGVATKEDVDMAMMLGANFPMGPFALADYVGLDVALAALTTLYDAFGEFYKPSESLTELVKNGHLGMKTGKGFYEHVK
ncbi:MAG: 3-hydroxyacyl-CoA dehydrogenase family protein [Theionarchaea archaeon]|nr:3-hydroxyacyl-CoA dehydrogenase family protein [Theionarchaea archaeon]MBU7038510.1 3-hydroxyacyl-CoA dehydrogenase family protein [Theionarchaea archaeon]